MHSVIAVLTTLATLFHLTVGCCLHASHCDGDGGCPHGRRAACHAEPCCGAHEHDQDSSLAMLDAEGSEPLETRHLAEAPPDACDGCECVGTVEKNPASDWTRVLTCSSAAFEGGAIARSQAACGSCGMRPPAILSELQPPLFERLLV